MLRSVLAGLAAVFLLAATPALAQTSAFDRGVQAYNAGNFAGAAAAFDEAYRANPQVAVLRNRALSYYKAQAYERAIADYQTLSSQTQEADDLVMYANALDQGGQYERSIPVYERAATLPPGKLSAWQELGVAHSGAGKYSLAADAYAKAVATRPDDAKLRFSHANALYDSSRFAEALPAYQAATRLDAGNAKAWRYLGNTQAKLNDIPGAMVSFDRALGIEPNSYDSTIDKGSALYNAKDYAGAIPLYRRATQLNPKSATAHGYLGDALRLTKDYAAARKSYETALTLDPKLVFPFQGLIPILIVTGDTAAAKARIDQLRPLDAAAANKYQAMLPQ
ncbi:tetratricopeptide repeat protein [Caulobacter sp. NIBR1757]|uniref:tetratricopeptide repeat protein n=1 Tax=Caulobacter sp. NIBR1757 TaxID=3016000 RepID=UPI0022F06AD1|nr:tetratricopeptide repeat protein [Caulobacter sp. NIBR1757]WGM38288.1 Cell division coordinator CpoB [Caulobacter sp. NIBR1757]